MSKCPKQFAPKYYKRYVDDTFLLFASEDHVNKFYNYINTRHQNITFTFDIEKDGSLPFLDVLVTRENDNFYTSVYRKPTFSGLYTNYESYISDNYKKGLIYTLLFRIFTLCIDWHKFDDEVIFLRDTLRKNLYPCYFIDKCIKIFLSKQLRPTKIVSEPKKEFKICLPFLGNYSNEIKKKLSSLVSRHLSGVKVTVIWKSQNIIRNFFSFKDKLPMHLRSKVLNRAMDAIPFTWVKPNDTL